MSWLITPEFVSAEGVVGVPWGQIPANLKWTPADTTTALWLDASDATTVTTVSGGVSEWNDKSGNARHATQTDSTLRPTVVTGSINSLNAIRYDGVNDLLNLPAITASAGIALFFVLRQNKQSSFRNGGIVAFTSATASSNHFGGGAGGSRDWFDSFYSTARLQVSSTEIPNGVYVGSIKQTGTQMVGKVIGLIDTAVNATFNGTPSLCTVGTAFGSGDTKSQNDYAELVLVQSPSAGNELRLEGYLAHKWGLTASLPNNHPYKNVVPTP